MCPLLENIPQEIMDIILQYLPDWKDISRLSSVSRKTREKTIASLFASISMLWEGNAATAKTLEAAKTLHSPRLDLLLRTIVEKPHLAEHIKIIELQAVGFRYLTGLWFTPGPLVALEHSLVDRLKIHIRSSGYRDSEAWEVAVTNGEVDVCVALLLMHLPNLTSLTLGIDILRNSRFLPEVLFTALTFPGFTTTLSQLKHVRLGSRVSETEDLWLNRSQGLPSSLDARIYLAFFYCPILEELQVNLVERVMLIGFKSIEREPQLASLKVLRLRESTITQSTLSRILSWTPRLARLEYDYKFHYDNNLECVELDKTLALVRNTLEYFKFVCHVWSGESIGPEEVDEAFVEDRCSFANCPLLDTFTSLPASCSAGRVQTHRYFDKRYHQAYESYAFTTSSISSRCLSGTLPH